MARLAGRISGFNVATSMVSADSSLWVNYCVVRYMHEASYVMAFVGTQNDRNKGGRGPVQDAVRSLRFIVTDPTLDSKQQLIINPYKLNERAEMGTEYVETYDFLRGLCGRAEAISSYSNTTTNTKG